jgi:hypothetical protein
MPKEGLSAPLLGAVLLLDGLTLVDMHVSRIITTHELPQRGMIAEFAGNR